MVPPLQSLPQRPSGLRGSRVYSVSLFLYCHAKQFEQAHELNQDLNRGPTERGERNMTNIDENRAIC